MFSHLGLTVNHQEDIENFYKGILSLEEKYNFTIGKDYSSQIFGIDQETPVYLLAKDDLQLELFLTDIETQLIYNHIEIYVHDLDKILTEVKSRNYPLTTIERNDKQDLIFIADKSGNKFEIKTSQ